MVVLVHIGDAEAQRDLVDEEGLGLKLETRQLGASYKMRGIRSYLAELPFGVRQLEVLSAGNMARSLALAIRGTGRRLRACVPDTIPAIKAGALRELGVDLQKLSFQELWSRVENVDPRPELVHPIDSPAILSGYGSLARELLGQSPGVDEVILPFGVGGLTLGVAFELKRVRPELRIVAAENAFLAPLAAAYRNGESSPVAGTRSWIDAIGTPRVLPRVFDAVRTGKVPGLGDAGAPLLDEIRLVEPDVALAHARSFYRRRGETLEGAAAIAYAAARGDARETLRLDGSGRVGAHPVVVLSGGNVDPELLRF